jgi:hypothetical protein
VAYEDEGNGPRVRLPESAHREVPWRIHEIAADFRLEDVWALPTPGGPSDFPQLVQQFAAADPTRSLPRAARSLFVIREKLGARLGWDEEDASAGRRVPSLRERMPADLLEHPGPEFEVLPATSLYLLEDEWAAEVANRTVHGVLHLAWVPAEEGGYRGQMAVLVKPNGLFGKLYLAAIKPFRYLVVYPQLLRQIRREWQRRAADPEPAHTS